WRSVGRVHQISTLSTTAMASAGKGWFIRAATVPYISPGPMKRSTDWPPSARAWTIFTRPSSRLWPLTPGSPWAKTRVPEASLRTEPAPTTASRASEDRPANMSDRRRISGPKAMGMKSIGRPASTAAVGSRLRGGVCPVLETPEGADPSSGGPGPGLGCGVQFTEPAMPALRSSTVPDTPAAAPRAELAGCDLCAAFATASAAPRSPFAPGEQLFRQGDPVRLVYRVLKGAVISYRLLSDGRRQVTAFH